MQSMQLIQFVHSANQHNQLQHTTHLTGCTILFFQLDPINTIPNRACNRGQIKQPLAINLIIVRAQSGLLASGQCVCLRQLTLQSNRLKALHTKKTSLRDGRENSKRPFKPNLNQYNLQEVYFERLISLIVRSQYPKFWEFYKYPFSSSFARVDFVILIDGRVVIPAFLGVKFH
jgi:hypothetical protein